MVAEFGKFYKSISIIKTVVWLVGISQVELSTEMRVSARLVKVSSENFTHKVNN